MTTADPAALPVMRPEAETVAIAGSEVCQVADPAGTRTAPLAVAAVNRGVVHHDLNTVPQYFDWVTMVNKQTVAYGPVADTFTDEAIERTYGKGRIV